MKWVRGGVNWANIFRPEPYCREISYQMDSSCHILLFWPKLCPHRIYLSCACFLLYILLLRHNQTVDCVTVFCNCAVLKYDRDQHTNVLSGKSSFVPKKNLATACYSQKRLFTYYVSWERGVMKPQNQLCALQHIDLLLLGGHSGFIQNI